VAMHPLGPHRPFRRREHGARVLTREGLHRQPACEELVDQVVTAQIPQEEAAGDQPPCSSH